MDICSGSITVILDIVYVLPRPSSIFAALLHVRLFAFGFKEQDKHCGGVFLTPSFHQLPPAETKRFSSVWIEEGFFFPHYINIQGCFFFFNISPVGLHCFRVMSTVSFGFTVLANDFAGLSAPLCICTVLKCVIVQTLVWFTEFMDNERGSACILCLDFK